MPYYRTRRLDVVRHRRTREASYVVYSPTPLRAGMIVTVDSAATLACPRIVTHDSLERSEQYYDANGFRDTFLAREVVE